MKTRLLEADPDLASYLPPDSVPALTASLIADVIEVPAGDWHPTRIESPWTPRLHGVGGPPLAAHGRERLTQR